MKASIQTFFVSTGLAFWLNASFLNECSWGAPFDQEKNAITAQGRLATASSMPIGSTPIGTNLSG
jgi:hypothetical protein